MIAINIWTAVELIRWNIFVCWSKSVSPTFDPLITDHLAAIKNKNMKLYETKLLSHETRYIGPGIMRIRTYRRCRIITVPNGAANYRWFETMQCTYCSSCARLILWRGSFSHYRFSKRNRIFLLLFLIMPSVLWIHLCVSIIKYCYHPLCCTSCAPCLCASSCTLR